MEVVPPILTSHNAVEVAHDLVIVGHGVAVVVLLLQIERKVHRTQPRLIFYAGICPKSLDQLSAFLSEAQARREVQRCVSPRVLLAIYILLGCARKQRHVIFMYCALKQRHVIFMRGHQEATYLNAEVPTMPWGRFDRTYPDAPHTYIQMHVFYNDYSLPQASACDAQHCLQSHAYRPSDLVRAVNGLENAFALVCGQNSHTYAFSFLILPLLSPRHVLAELILSEIFLFFSTVHCAVSHCL